SIAELEQIVRFRVAALDHVRVDSIAAAEIFEAAHPHRTRLRERLRPALALKSQTVESFARHVQRAGRVRDQQIDDAFSPAAGYSSAAYVLYLQFGIALDDQPHERLRDAACLGIVRKVLN